MENLPLHAEISGQTSSAITEKLDSTSENSREALGMKLVADASSEEAGEKFSYFAHESYTPGSGSYGSTTDSGLYTLFPPPSTGEIASIQDGKWATLPLVSLSSSQQKCNAIYARAPNGSTKRGDSCEFDHVYKPPKQARLCEQFARGNCVRGEFCKFIHTSSSEPFSNLSEPNRLLGAAVEKGKAGGGGEGIDTGSLYTLYCGNLPDHVDEPALQTLFQPYGPETAMLAYDDTGRSKGHAFVIMNNMEKCKAAIKGLHGMVLGGQPIIVRSGPEREDFSRQTAHRLYVGNLDCSTTAEELHEAFNAHGGVTFTKMLVTKSGECYGFVWYSSKEEMERALTAFDGMELKGQVLQVQLSRSRGTPPLQDQ